MSAVESLCLGKFHSHIRDVFAPQVVRYIDLMESSVAQSVHVGFEKETWQPQGYAEIIITHCLYATALCIMLALFALFLDTEFDSSAVKLRLMI